MKRTIEILLRLVAPPVRLVALLLAVGAAGGAWAGFEMTNPVTGQKESYTYKFIGTDSVWNNAANWQDSNGSNPSAVPAASNSNTWEPILFDQAENQSIAIGAALSVEGWNLRMGLYNGASVTLKNLQKLQGGLGMWITVDSSSHCTIEAMANKKLANANPLCLYSANEGGIAWTQELSSSGNGSGDTAMPFHYYLAGNGTVAYNGGIAAAAGGAHVIKQADVTLSGTSEVVPKPLVSFTSSSTTFTANAAIKVYDTDGSTLKKLVGVTAVRQSGATIANTSSVLTTADAVGTCEIVQCTDGIVLYYVDGAPSAVTGYTPSININFTNGNGLSTVAEVGLSGYAVLGTSWNNFTIPNNSTEQTFSTVASIDSTGVASTASGVSVTVSGHRGVYQCSNLDAGSNPLHGYVDEGGATGSNTATPTVTITGIPYANYRLIVYHSTDSTDLPFGYDTINGTDFTYVDGVQAIGTTSWGNSGASNSANAIAEGVNTLVSGILSGSTATMVAHRVGTANSASVRGCFAAIQVVEVVVSDTELVIPVTGATTYTVDADKEYEKVIISGTGTLTLDGTGTITTDVLEIENNSAIVMNSSRLAATTVIGKGTAIYDGEVPPTDKGWTDSANWKGTVWIKNMSGITGNSTAGTGVQPNNLGNDKSKVKFSGVSGWLEAPITYTPEIVLENDAYDYALKLTNGNSPDNKNNNENRCTVIKKLSGSGKVTCGATSSAWPTLKVYDASAYTGDIDCGSSGTCLVVVFAAENETLPDTLFNLFKNVPRSIYISADGSAKVASGATWTANSGITVNGTLYANGTLASSAATAVKGTGTVVFTGRAPTPVDGENETKWWKNANWTGTVQIANVTDSVGDNRTGTWLKVNDYGNTGSVVEFNGVTGWLTPNYTCTVPLKITNTLTINNGSSGAGNAFKVKTLLGDGIIGGSGSAPYMVFQVTDDWSGFTGAVQLSSSKVVAFGSTIPATIADANDDAGAIYIAKGAEVEIKTSGNWWASGKGFVIDGTLTAADRNKWGGGTAVTVNETGVLKLAMTGNIDATGATATSNARYLGNIGGTGTILLSGTKWLGLPKTDDAAFMWASTLAVSNCLTSAYGGLVFTRNTTIGTLSGTGLLRSDLDTSGTGNRVLTILQSADSEWSGTLYNVDLTKQISVAAKQGATAKTLKLSGTQTATKPLVVEAATETTDAGSVNLTGTWKGDTTVSGTFGGTGTLTGNLTFNAGSTFKAFASDEDGLSVSGTVAYPEEGTVTVDVSDLTLSSSGTTLITFTSAPSAEDIASKMVPSSGAFLKLDGSTLKAYPLVATYNGEDYATFEAAINAALADEGGEANLAQITVVDGSAELPAGYYIDTENNNILAMYQAAIVKTDSSKVYFKTPQLAFDDISANANLLTYMQGYTCVEVYYGKGTEILINASAAIWNYGQAVKIRCLNGSTVSVSTTATESTLTAGTADENGIITYTSTPVAITYVWAGGTTLGPWSNPMKWKVGTLAGADATRKPGALDTVQIGDGAKVSDIVGSLSVAALQVSGTVTFTGGGTLTSASAITLGASDSITITGTLSPTPTTSVANSYVKATTSDKTTTYVVDAYKTVTITGSNMTAMRTDGIENLKYGDVVTFTITPNSGYAVTGVMATSGDVTESNGVYSYTVTQDATITVTTVSTAVTFGAATFDYYATYASAKTVTAAVMGHVVDGTTFTMTVGENNYPGTYENGVVTFSDVTVGGLGTTTSYTITATGGSTGASPFSAAVGSTEASSGWMSWSESGSNVGGWTDELGTTRTPTYTSGAAMLTGTNIYTAAWTSTGEVVMVTTSVSFGSPANSALTVDADAQAAIRIGTEQGANVFQIYAGPTPSWVSVYNDTLGTPADDATYALTLTLNYASQTFGVSVGDAGALTNAAGDASFPLAKAASSMQKVSYLGAGTFTSLAGSYVSAGYSADVGTEGNATNVVVAQSFVSDYLSSVSASEISTYLNPNATSGKAIAKNGLNYFTSYALGLDPTKADDKPIVDVTTDAEGKFVFTVKHPVYNAQGEITGYKEIDAADNVSTTVTLKYGTDAASVATAESSPADGISPAAMFSQDGLNGSNVIYYKAEVTIRAK